MSLKSTKDIDIERHPELWSKEIVTAVENLKEGKLGAKRKLKKFVNREITYKYYEELVERYKDANKKKGTYIFGHPIKEWLPVLQFFLIDFAIYGVLSQIKNPNNWTYGSVIYLLISFFLYHYSNVDEKEQKDYEIVELKREIYKLKEISKSDKAYIEFFEKELDKRINSQQE